jgi:transposase
MCVNAITEPARRLEVFTGSGRRRRWSAEDKARIVAETIGDSVCAVARKERFERPTQIFRKDTERRFSLRC